MVRPLHVQVEQVRFGDDEVQVLVVDLRQMLRRVCLHYLGAKVFEERTRYAGEEVQVCWAVEAAREDGRDGLEVLRRGLDEIYDWNLFMSAWLLVGRDRRAHTSGIICRVVPMFRCIVT